MTLTCRVFVLLWSVAAWVATGTPAWAARSEPPIDEWHHTIWAAKDGAPRDVWSMSQTPNGWMWFGASDGLYRFDGTTFERVDTEPAGSNRSRAVTSLLALDSGALVVGYRNGGVAILKDGHAVDFHERDGFDNVTVFGVAAAADGHIWAATRTGLHLFDGQRWQRLGPAQGIPDAPVTAVKVDRAGRTWISSAARILHAERGEVMFVPGPTIGSPADFPQAPDGRLWYHTVSELHPCPLQDDAAGHAAPPTIVSGESTFDARGGLWFTESTAVLRLVSTSGWPAGLSRDELEATTAADRVAFPGLARTMLLDREGAVWVATVDGEIHQFREMPESQVSFPRHMVVRGAVEATPDGAVWAASRSSYYGASNGDGLWRIDGEPVHVQPDEIRSATMAFASRHGTLSVAGDGWLWVRLGDHFVRDVAVPSHARANPVVAMADDPPTGSMWVSMLGAGLFLRRGDDWQRNGGVADLPDAAATALASDADGTLWIGYADGSVIAMRGADDARTLQVRGAPVGAVRVISVGRHVLVGGDRGLAILQDGQLRGLSTDEPAAFSVLTGIVQTPAGDAWLNGRDGAVRIQGVELQRVMASTASTVTVGVYDTAEGYSGHGATTLPYGNTMALAADSKVWFCGAAVPAWLDPADIRSDRASWPLVLRSLTTAAGRVDAVGPLRLAAGTRDVQIDYTTLDYAHPDRERFRYRLVGLDDRWTVALSRRQAFFTNLGPGRYRFEVESKSGPTDWTTAPVTLDIDIPATFTESRTFIALCTLAGVLALAVVMRMRDRSLRRIERAKDDERLAERERIARELHDTLLQSTQGLVLKFQAVTSRMAADDKSRVVLQDALKEADELMVEGRDRIQNLRLDTPPADRLGIALDALGRKLSAQQGAAFELVVDGTPRALRPVVADEAHRVGSEALLNAFQHARAKRIEVELIYARDALRMRVRDDGVGIDSHVLEKGYAPDRWGLRGMRERAERVGATLEVLSAAGAGTEIEFVAPAGMAYTMSDARGWAWIRTWFGGARDRGA